MLEQIDACPSLWDVNEEDVTLVASGSHLGATDGRAA